MEFRRPEMYSKTMMLPGRGIPPAASLKKGVMNMKRAFAIILSAAMAVGAVAGFTVTAQAEEKVTVRILTRYSNPDNAREKYFMDKVAQFQEENPDIDLQDVSISDEESHDTLFKTSVAASDPIEVFNFLGYAANLDYVQNGVITDISGELEADPEWGASYIDALFAPVDYSAFGVDGIYGMPTPPYGVCCFYNAKIFEELGIEMPESWEAIEAAAPAIIEAGYIPMAFGAKDNYRAGHFLTALSMKMYGSDLNNALISGEKKWNDPEMLGLVQQMQDWYEAGLFGDNNLAYDANGELAKLEGEEAAIIFSGSWNIGTINGASNISDIVCKGFPYFESKPEFKDAWMGGPDDFMSMSSKPEDPDYEATLRVLKFFTSDDYYLGLYEALGGAGTYPINFEKTIEADALTTEFNDYYSVATDMIGEIEQFSPMTSLMDLVRTEVTTIFSGDSAEDIVNRIQDEVDYYNDSNA